MIFENVEPLQSFASVSEIVGRKKVMENFILGMRKKSYLGALS